MTSVSLAWRFARGGTRRSRVLALITIVGIALGVAVLLGGLSVRPALAARDARQAQAGMISGQRTHDVLLVVATNSTFDDRELTVRFAAPVGDAPIPPGLTRPPAPGEIVASPALRAILEGPDRDLLAVRVPGRAVGTIADPGLEDPDQLFAYVGADAAQLRARDAQAVTRFGVPANEPPLDPGLVIAIVAASVGVLLSVVVFIWTVTRLGAGARESRSATLRLLGMTPGGLRAMTGVEIGLVAAVGSLAGYALFLVARSFVPWNVLLPGDAGMFPSDLRPPALRAAAVLVVVPALAIVVAWVALRRVTAEPLAVARHAATRRWPISLWAVILTVGIGSWVALWIFQPTGPASEAAILLGWIATATGLLGVAPWVGGAGASIATRRGGLGAWLGSRRLAFDRRPAARISVGIVTVVFAGSVSTGLLGMYVQDRVGTTSGDDLLPTTLVANGATASDLATIRSVSGVTAAEDLGWTGVRVEGRGRVTALVARCAALGAVITDAPTCEGGALALAGSGIAPGTRVRVPGHGSEQAPVVRIGGSTSALDWLTNSLGALILLDGSELGIRPHSAMQLIATDGDPTVDERVREALGSPSDHVVSITTEAGYEPMGWSHEAAIARALGWAASVAVVIAAASLLVAMAGAIDERRRPLAVLAATGVPASTLRRSFAVQAMAPLIAGVVLAIGCASVVVGYHAATEYSGSATAVRAGLAPGLRLAAFALLAGLLATLLTVPSIGRSIAPEALRTE